MSKVRNIGFGESTPSAAFMPAFMAALSSGVSYDGALDADPTAPPEAALKSIDLKASVKTGTASTVFKVSGDQIGSLAAVLADFNVDAEEVVDPNMTMEETVRRTIQVDTESGNVSFKLSLAKHSRSVNVPVAEWPQFVAYLQGLDSKLVSVVERARKVREDANAEERRKAAEKAKKAGLGINPLASK
jgi:hypothetical protein